MTSPNEFKNYLSINLSTSNNTKIDISKVSSITYDIDSNVITFTPETMYKFEVLGTASNVTVNDQGQMMISNLNLFEHLGFVKLSDFFNSIQAFIKTNKFTNEDFLDYVKDTNNLETLKQLVADNLYISDSKKINIDKILNVNISNNNLTVTLDNGYAVYNAESNTNVTLATNVLTITNLKFYTITNIVKLDELHNYIQSIIDISINKFTESQLFDYIVDNQDTLKTEVASKIYINEYENIPVNQITSITLDENNQVKVSLDSNYIKYDVESYENVGFENDELIVKNLEFYNVINVSNLSNLETVVKNWISNSSNLFTIDEFGNQLNSDAFKKEISDSLSIQTSDIANITFTNNTLTIEPQNKHKFVSNDSTNLISNGSISLQSSDWGFYSIVNVNESILNTLRTNIQNYINNNSITEENINNYLSNQIFELIKNTKTTDNKNLGEFVDTPKKVGADINIPLKKEFIKLNPNKFNNIEMTNNSIILKNFTFFYIPASPDSWFTWNGTVITGLTNVGLQQTNIKLPSKTTSIADYIFKNNTKIESIDMSLSGIKTIGVSAFEGCKKLKWINLPNSLTSIRQWAFMYCESLTWISIPNSVTLIDNYVFYGCINLININIPNGVSYIGIATFYNCKSLTSINIPDGITNIYLNAFNGCSSLTSVTIPNSVKAIGNNAFNGVKQVIVPNKDIKQLVLNSGYNESLIHLISLIGNYK